MSEKVRLSLADLEVYREQGKGLRAGRHLRFFCPIHGSDHQRSLALEPESGRFHCFTCGSWGYLEEKRQAWREERQRETARRRPGDPPSSRRKANPARDAGETPLGGAGPSDSLKKPQTRPELAALLPDLQKALPGSLGERYLRARGIPLELAQACGVGYAAPGRWPHRGRDWVGGRLVFPHTNAAGEVVNLYGRAVGSYEKVPKEKRHDHLPGPKGLFNARALLTHTVFVCEGAFDALSLMAAGILEEAQGACAIFGIDGLRWEWMGSKRVVFCLDQDTAGQKWRELAWEGILRGKEIYWLPELVYGGKKDLNEVWVEAGRIEIGDWDRPLRDSDSNRSAAEPAVEPPAEVGQVDPPLVEAPPLVPEPLAGPELVQEACRLLKTQGWALIGSEVLGEPVVWAVDKEAARLAPTGCVVYTVEELQRLRGIQPEELRRVHQGKRLFSGRIMEGVKGLEPWEVEGLALGCVD